MRPEGIPACRRVVVRTGPGGRAVALRVALRIAVAVALCTVPVHVLRGVCL